MPAITFEWSEHFSSRVPATEVGKVIRKLERKHGECHPAMLVEEARSEDSPIHDVFGDLWDDAIAAERQRVEYARRIIRSVRIVKANRPQPGPAFVHLRRMEEDEAHNGYVSTDRALSDPDMRERVLNDALRQLEGLEHRYRTLGELAPVWDAVQRVKRVNGDERKAA
jgi:hypothetical protein